MTDKIHDAEAMVAAADTGGRKPSGWQLKTLLAVALCWAVFQVWIASPLPYLMESDLLRWNGNQARSIHLGFALLLAYLSFPFGRHSARRKIPLQDWLLALTACLAALYYVIEYRAISDRVGAPILQDIVVACIGVPLMLEAARRSLGSTLAVIASVFLLYSFFGNYMPEIIQHKGYSLAEVVNHQWITTEGVFGVALGVSTDFVFLFVLFGALLDKAGAGQYFIQLAFACLGHFKGGPAKAAVVASGMTGLISGSSIANVVTTGTFTVPMMKRVGFSAEKAGAVEVASSVNGQIMPPVMGAAAFLMVEYVGISYFEVISHAFLPALISYIALVYIVHLEAIKANLQGIPRGYVPKPLVQAVSGFLLGFLLLSSMALAVYYGLGWLKPQLGSASGWVIGAGLIVLYISALSYANRYRQALVEQANNTETLPRPGPIFKAGLHYLLPVFILIWCLMVERLSPGLSAFWATCFTMLMIVTRPSLEAFFSHEKHTGKWLSGLQDLADGLITGARNMVGIAIATATAGIIVGAVSQTSVGAVLADLVEVLSFGSVALMLLLVAVLCMILGMGLPTTANYIVVSSLMASVIIEVGAANGLIVPLIAVHLFVFYFGLMADITPPVGLASFAAAAVSGGDPLRTGLVAFRYALRTAALPFLFVFNTDLLLIDVTWLEGLFTFVLATLAMLIFTAATQGYFFARSKWWESALLLVAALSIFRADLWIDQISDKYTPIPASQLQQLEGLKPGEPLRIYVQGETALGDPREFVTVLVIRQTGQIEQQLANLGLGLYKTELGLEVDMVAIGSDAANAGLEAFQIISGFDKRNSQPSRGYVYLLVMLLVGWLAWRQRQRKQLEVKE